MANDSNEVAMNVVGHIICELGESFNSPRNDLFGEECHATPSAVNFDGFHSKACHDAKVVRATFQNSEQISIGLLVCNDDIAASENDLIRYDVIASETLSCCEEGIAAS